ncbi:MAG: hypothetical protein DCE90_19890 [Pseudanabaena sp.]|nr:MAG: hypothetical protein DCE90_19890 [Pseudanabaena sp.]
MIESSSRPSLADVDTDKLVALSERWVNESQKRNNPKTKLDIIRTMESGIRALITSGYTYEEVSKKLTDELEIAISAQIVRKYLQRIDAENKTAATKAKRDLQKSTKALNTKALTILPSEPARFLDDDSSASATDRIITGSAKRTTRMNSDIKQTTPNDSGKPKSIVPKSVPTDEDDDDDYLAQQKILKHYNRY